MCHIEDRMVVVSSSSLRRVVASIATIARFVDAQLDILEGVLEQCEHASTSLSHGKELFDMDADLPDPCPSSEPLASSEVSDETR